MSCSNAREDAVPTAGYFSFPIIAMLGVSDIVILPPNADGPARPKARLAG